MGLNFFRKSSDDKKLRAVVGGEVIPITAVADSVFSGKVLGDGVAFVPNGNRVVAPAEATVIVASAAMPHAVSLHLNNGTEVLIHIGVNTVEMNGEGFTLKVKQGQKVRTGQTLVKFDPNAIQSAGYDSTVMLIVTESDSIPGLKLYSGMRAVAGKTVVAEL